MKTKIIFLAIFCFAYINAFGAFNDIGWQVQYQENFDGNYEAVDGQSFGTDNWLIYQLINGASITVANGYAHIKTFDFENAALIRSLNSLPDEYKIRTKIGYINYDLTNYEQADYDNPNFNTHEGNYENGMYFLTLANDTCVGNECAENWWHYHRKMVIDVDNHINWGTTTETFHPVYMVYMAPETNSGGNLLRTWDGSIWDTSPWNWNVAYTYDYNSWYYAELEKKNGYIILRLYDENQNLLEETSPADINNVFAMDQAQEFLYVGEPHTDDYEGDVRVDEITLLVPDESAINVISDFESGNVTNVQQIGADSVSFEIRLDDGYGDTYGWYYFAITGQMGNTLTMFLANPDAWQDANDCPRYSNDNKVWNVMGDVWNQNDTVVMRHYFENDTVWFAQSIPFTRTNFSLFMDSVSEHILSVDTIGYSVHGRPIDLITITDTTWSDENKKTVWLISRQHPMESQATYVLKGLMKSVLDDTDFAEMWRRNIILKVVPIINVDGVVEGYSRHNVNGYNLNRNWQTIISNEQPEVNSVHSAIDDYINSGNKIDFFMDLHAAPGYDYGFRMSDSHVDSIFYANQTAFLTLMDNYDHWQNRYRWGVMGTAGPSGGVSAWVLNSLYGLDGLTSENTWSRREDYTCVEANSLIEEGGNWALAIYDYLFPLQAAISGGEARDNFFIEDSFFVKLQDYLQCDTDSLLVNIYSIDASDSEKVYVKNQYADCDFVSDMPLKFDANSPSTFDGVISIQDSNKIVLEYSDPGTPDRIYYRLLDVKDSNMVVSVGDDNNSILPSGYSLSQNYPNPYNFSTRISYEIPASSQVKLAVYNILGQEIRVLVDEFHVAGRYDLTWDSRDNYGKAVSSGIYFYKLETNNFVDVKKMIFLK